MNLILYLWQLPQNLIGYLLTRKVEFQIERQVEEGKYVTIYFSRYVFGCAVSLGQYILLDYYQYCGRNNTKTVLHEYGHTKQSLMLGWLYLPVVGLWSAIRNIWDRLYHKEWSALDRMKWYYNGYPEKWADKLGKVDRWV